ncbi:hypothetical protein SAMD00019534_031790, partial [Acytostelium subglobosum LB1]|uniref:hypothetical protein n=1 Tax=Acytostelium subglobosum LB1 TaxID=1410327 RepID=UPI0006450ED2
MMLRYISSNRLTQSNIVATAFVKSVFGRSTTKAILNNAGPTSSSSIIYYSTSTTNKKNETTTTTTTTTTTDDKHNIIDPSIRVDASLLVYQPKPGRKMLKIDEMTDESKQKWYLKLMGLYSFDSLSLNNSHSIYDAIANQTANPEMYKAIGLPTTVRGWFAMTVLHMWMVFVRLRKDGKDGSKLTTDLYDRFWEDLETRIVRGGINHRFAAKYLKEFYNSYLGSMVSYDEAMFDDAIMSDALWRNLLAMNENVSFAQLDLLVRYIRRQLNQLDNNPNVATRGDISFVKLIDINLNSSNNNKNTTKQ